MAVNCLEGCKFAYSAILTVCSRPRADINKFGNMQFLTVQMLMLKSILAGQAPSQVFRQVFSSELVMDNYRLADMLADEYVEYGSQAGATIGP